MPSLDEIPTKKDATEKNKDDEIPTKKDAAEKDKDGGENYLFIILFYLLGTTCFIPHSFFVTANQYWMYKFRDLSLPFDETDTAEKTTLQKDFTAYSGIAGTIGMTVFVFVTAALSRKIGLQKRIIGGMVFLLCVFIVLLIFIFIDTDSWQEEFFVITLTICGLLHAAAAILLVSIFQLAVKFEPKCLAAQMAGQSLCGIFSSLFQIICISAFNSIKASAALYYSTATFILVAILVIYILVLYRSEEFHKHLHSDREPLHEKPKFKWSMITHVFKKLYLFIIAIGLSMGNTIVLHPGVTNLIESYEKGSTPWGDTYFLPVCVFFSFNIFEFIGRESSNHLTKINTLQLIFVVSILRLALFPIILLCNLQPRHHLPVVFDDDAYFIIIFIIFAFSSGYVVNAVIVKHVEYCEPEERALGSAVITVIMILLTPLFNLLSGVVVNLI